MLNDHAFTPWHTFDACFFASSVFTKSRRTVVADCVSLLFSSLGRLSWGDLPTVGDADQVL
jgi:hypothetical protein